MKIPSHIAIIMDGNGRWAKKKGYPRSRGHQAGVKTLRKIVKKADQLGVKCLTVYAFSTENWKRPSSEVNFLMDLLQKTFIKESLDLIKNNVQVKIIGRRQGLKKVVVKAIEKIENKTSKNDGLILNIAFNYGGRAEIIDTVKKIVSEKKVNIEQLTENDFNNYIYNSFFPPVELLIRTGGEQRLSNFLLWQLAYAEIYFTDKYWPEFSQQDLVDAINFFAEKERRFGGLVKGDNNA